MAQESSINPRDLRNTFVDAIETNKALTAVLFDLLLWFKGDTRLGQLAVVTITAGNSADLIIEPPDATEEWEIFAIQINDNASIDATDNVEVLWGDNVSGIFMPLQDSQLQADTAGLGNQMIWPSRDTTKAKLNIVDLVRGLIVRRKDSKTPWLRVDIRYKATATVGSRTVNTAFMFARRRLS
jgi:hypothetical protein